MDNKKYTFTIQRPVVTMELIYVEADSEEEALKLADNESLWADAEPDPDYYEILYDRMEVIDKEVIDD